MTPRQALENVGKTKTQVFNLDVKALCKKEFAILEKLVKESENVSKRK